MRTPAILCFVLAAVSSVVALNNSMKVINGPGGLSENSSYVVGGFLIPIVSLIGGLHVWNKTEPESSS